MTLYTLSIRRPVLAIVLSITIVLFGLLGFSYLGVREFPSLDPPNITVSTNYRGASVLLRYAAHRWHERRMHEPQLVSDGWR